MSKLETLSQLAIVCNFLSAVISDPRISGKDDRKPLQTKYTEYTRKFIDLMLAPEEEPEKFEVKLTEVDASAIGQLHKAVQNIENELNIDPHPTSMNVKEDVKKIMESPEFKELETKAKKKPQNALKKSTSKISRAGEEVKQDKKSKAEIIAGVRTMNEYALPEEE